MSERQLEENEINSVQETQLFEKEDHRHRKKKECEKSVGTTATKVHWTLLKCANRKSFIRNWTVLVEFVEKCIYIITDPFNEYQFWDEISIDIINSCFVIIIQLFAAV